MFGSEHGTAKLVSLPKRAQFRRMPCQRMHLEHRYSDALFTSVRSALMNERMVEYIKNLRTSFDRLTVAGIAVATEVYIRIRHSGTSVNLAALARAAPVKHAN